MIIFIDDIYRMDDHVTIRAMIEDAALVYSGSYYDPPEYGQAMCTTSFYLGEDDLPEEEEKLISYLNKLDLNWDLLEKDWDY